MQDFASYACVTLFLSLFFPEHTNARTVRSPTPPMGWNSYNAYNCYPNETIMKSNAQGLVDLGFADLGYNVVTTDCGWPAQKRSSTGELYFNETLFPSGGKGLSDFIHNLGLKVGLYSGAGFYQCGSNAYGVAALPASLNHEAVDAKIFEVWEGDFLKYDNCWANESIYVDYTSNWSTSPMRFETMADELQGLDRDFQYEICQWGVGTNLETWASGLAETWRVANDIATSAPSTWASIWRIANQVVPYWKTTGIGKWPDMDMLAVGLNALNSEEERFHFSLWAINKSPLVIGAIMDPAVTSNESLSILANKEIIAINQDPLGAQARLIRRYTEEEYDIWAGNLTNGSMLVAALNWANTSTEVTINMLDTVGVQRARNMRDVWAAKEMGNVDGAQNIQLNLAGHEAKVLILSGVSSTTPRPKANGSKYYPATDAELSGTAYLESCNDTTVTNSPHGCAPVGSKITGLGNSSSAVFSVIDIPVPSSNATVSSRIVGIDYVNYATVINNTDTNTLNLTVAVNNNTARRWALPISGGDWWDTGRLDVEVDGFMVGKQNRLTFSLGQNMGSRAPDIVGIELFY